MYSNYKSLIYNLLLLFLVTATIVTIKMPGTQDFPVYQLFYLVFFISIPHKLAYKQQILVVTSFCWGVIFIWGCFLAFSYGFKSHHFNNLLWVITIILSCHVFSALMQFDNRRYWIYRFFIIITSLIALSGIYEGLTGIYYHETDATYLFAKTELGFYRPNTIFYNVNDNAIFATLCLLLSSFYPEKLKEYWVVQLFSLFLFGANIIMVNSRGAILSTVAFLALSIIYYKFKRNAMLLIIMSIIISLPFFSMILQSEFFDDGGRNAIWAMSVKSLVSSSFMGVGPGEIAEVNSRLNVMKNVVAVHNFVLEIICDYGIIGALGMLVWFYHLFKSGYEMYKKGINFKMLPALIAFLLSSITCSSIVGKGFSLFFFAIIVAEMNRNLKKKKKNIK